MGVYNSILASAIRSGRLIHDFMISMEIKKKFGFDYYDNNGTLTKEVTWLKDDGKLIKKLLIMQLVLQVKLLLKQPISMRISTGQSLGSMLHKVMLLAHLMLIRV